MNEIIIRPPKYTDPLRPSDLPHPSVKNQSLQQNPERLLDFPLLHDTNATNWRAWFEGAAGINFRPRVKDRRFEDYPLCLSAAEAGLGIALGQWPLINEVMSETKLRRLTLPEVEGPQGYFLLLVQRRRSQATEKLVERLEKELTYSAAYASSKTHVSA